MISKKTRRWVTSQAADQYLQAVEFDDKGNQAVDARYAASVIRSLRQRVAGRIADRYGSSSLLSSIVVAIAIRFAYALILYWYENGFSRKELKRLRDGHVTK